MYILYGYFSQAKKQKEKKVEYKEKWLCGFQSMTWTSNKEIRLEGTNWGFESTSGQACQ